MRLKSITFSEQVGTPQEWTLGELEIGPKNLLVGKNATGKTRVLNVISGLSKFFQGTAQFPTTAGYICEFENEQSKYTYKLNIENHQVIHEFLSIDGVTRLERGPGGRGTIFAVEQGKDTKFQSPPTMLAALSRRDEIQHPFLEPIYTWGSSLRHITFGTTLGKDHFEIIKNENTQVEGWDQNKVVGIFRRSIAQHSDNFLTTLKSDLLRVGYSIDSIRTEFPITVLASNSPSDFVGLTVKEKDLPGVTDQISMSQGMFRVLSLLIHINDLNLRQRGACVLVDDIGEGLDFDRSCRLIKLLREKADKNDIQLIMTTNDRFIMNEVPLTEWSLLRRVGNHVNVHNYTNSKQSFESFKFTGLSNFSFLEMDFINEPISGDD